MSKLQASTSTKLSDFKGACRAPSSCLCFLIAGLDEYSNIAMEALKVEASSEAAQQVLAKISHLQDHTSGVHDGFGHYLEIFKYSVLFKEIKEK